MAAESPERHGQAWTLAEEQQLYDEFSVRTPLEEIAALHGRAPGGIRASLKRLGLVDDDGRRVDPLPVFTPTDAALKREEKSQQRQEAGNRRKTALEITLNPEQNERFSEALHLMNDTSKDLFITGRAGTGKSTLLAYFCRTTAKQPVVLAPTGVAALNVKGQTIHSFFGFGVDVTVDKIRTKKTKPRQAKLYKKLQMIVIDEVSMVRADLLDCIDMFLRLYGPHAQQPFGGVQMVFIGDLYQLPPVVTSAERSIFNTLYQTPYFFSARALDQVPIERIELNKIYRQKDQDFVDLLNKIRNNSVTATDLAQINTRVLPAPPNGDFSITLTTTNATADAINDERLTALPGKLQTASAKVSGDFTRDYFPTAPELTYKIGAQVMMLNNDSEKRWVNGSIGLITGTRRNVDGSDFLIIELQEGGDSVSVLPYTWEVYHFGLDGQEIVAEPAGSFTQYPFRLAWGITIHKSQGKTFDRVVIDTGRGAFATGQIYVALSRCTSFEGVTLKVPIRLSDIRTDRQIATFLDGGQIVADHTAGVASIIQKAMTEQAELEITYEKADGAEIICRVTPLSVGTASYQGHNYQGMRAILPGNAEPRMFRLDRIKQISRC